MRDVATGHDVPAGQASFGKDGAGRIRFESSSGAARAEVAEPGSGPKRFEVKYSLGASPMQQHIVATDNGRLQALPVAFDTTKREWFDIFSGEERLPGEYGHWSERGMNANSQCINCHTVAFRKNYDASTEVYSSTWVEAGVGCEACHGPGAAHVADPRAPYGPFGKSSGIAAYRPKPAATEKVETLAGHGNAPPAAALALDTCASCHSVRRELAEGFRPGEAFLDYYEPELLETDSYHPDGQVRSEAYEWGSYTQSRMHAAGVNCLACHDVHSGKLRAAGNELCTSCHEPAYTATAHTGHDNGSAGSQCVACHMPESVFMARDRRRDHSMSVPDPISAAATGIPSSCEQCHAGRSRETLAADAQRLWPALQSSRHAERRAMTNAFAQARRGSAEVAPLIRDCISGAECASATLRASAARLSARLPLDDRMAGALLDLLEDADPLLRSSAAFAFGEVDPREPMLRQWLSSAAADPVRAVRLNAAWALRRVETHRLPKEQAEPLHAAFDQWRASARVMSEAPETWHSLGVFETARREPAAAESAYRKAIAMEPRAVPSRHNLAMLLIEQNRITDAKAELEALVGADDSFAPAWYALGLIHSEQKRWTEAAQALGRCLKLDPDYPGALTDLTQAYLEAGVGNVARAVLTGALDYPPRRREALAGLVTVAIRTGQHDEAVAAAKRLVAEDPSAASDQQIAGLIAEPPPAAAP